MIGVILRCTFIEVSGGKKSYQFGSLCDLSFHQRELGMNLKTWDTFDDPDASTFHFFRPLNIVCLVEPGFQFHENNDAFSIPGCTNQSIYNARIVRYPI